MVYKFEPCICRFLPTFLFELLFYTGISSTGGLLGWLVGYVRAATIHHYSWLDYFIYLCAAKWNPKYCTVIDINIQNWSLKNNREVIICYVHNVVRDAMNFKV